MVNKMRLIKKKNDKTILLAITFSLLLIILVSLLFLVITFKGGGFSQPENIDGKDGIEVDEVANELESGEAVAEGTQSTQTDELVSLVAIAKEKGQFVEYKNNWYGFSLQQPKDWQVIRQKKITGKEKWEAKYLFQPKSITPTKVERGVEQKNNETDKNKANLQLDQVHKSLVVLVYSGKREVDEIEDSLFRLKNEMKKSAEAMPVISGLEQVQLPENKSSSQPKQEQVSNSIEKKSQAELVEADKGRACGDKQRVDYLIQGNGFPAHSMYISSYDKCFEPGLHFIARSKGYYYVLLTEDFFEENRVEEVNRDFPEFLQVAQSLKPIKIVRPKPKPKINAPKPVSYKKVGNRLVCEKKHDKPGKSKKNNKGKIHLDMECCLDPDEIPNPHCYYDPKKYGKYLKNPHTMSEKGKKSKKKKK